MREFLLFLAFDSVVVLLSFRRSINLGGLFSREYVTGPIVGSGGSISVSVVNTTTTETLADIVLLPGQVPGDGYPVPAQGVFTLTFDLGSGKAPPFQGWVSIHTQSDRVVPTVTVATDTGDTQVYLPGDLLVFDVPTGARLW
jgi:hypothetical protein